MARGMPGGMQVIDGVLPRPPAWRSACADARIAAYSGVSGACWPRPAGLVGSHWPTLSPVHCPDQSGYFHSARVGAAKTVRPTAADNAVARIAFWQIMSRLPVGDGRAEASCPAPSGAPPPVVP